MESFVMNDDLQLAQTLQEWSEVFMQHSFHEFKQFMDSNGLSPSQVITLFRLYHGGSCGVKAIGSQLGVTIAASSQLLDRLVLQGLIERTEDPADRRAKSITITNKGRALLEQGIDARRKWLEQLTKPLTAEQRSTVISALTLLTACASKSLPEIND
jgi:DNA-binding MarR family transcriptional regulator